MSNSKTSYLSLVVSLAAITISVSAILRLPENENITSANSSDHYSSNSVMNGTKSAKERAVERLNEIRSVKEGKQSDVVSNIATGNTQSEDKAKNDDNKSQEGNEPDKREERRVDLSLLQESRTHVQYDNSLIAKLGYDDEGRRMSPRETREDTKRFVQRILSQGKKFSFVYPAIGEEKKRVLVFSDPTCPYCQRLHSNLEQIREAGVTVHYMMFPRSLSKGEGDPTASRILASLEYAWCDEDPTSAMDRVYAGGIDRYRASSCEAPKQQGRVNFPYAEHYLMTKMADINATPVTLTEDGLKVQGFSDVRWYLDQIGL